VQGILHEVGAIYRCITPICLLNHTASTDSSFSSAKRFNDIRYIGGPHWMYLHSISSRFFTVVFSVGTESLNQDASSTCVH
jgi:hypothetical protein